MLQAQTPQFAPPEQLNVPVLVTVAIGHADFDTDGDQDLYLADFVSGGTWMNDGLAGFDLLPGGPPLAFGSTNLLFADVDGDADPDMFIFQHLQGPRLYRNDGGGVWTDLSATLPGWFPHVSAAVARDFDGDGDLDVAVVGHALLGGANRMLVNDGSGQFTISDVFPGYASSVAAADFDGDGDQDIVTGTLGPNLWRNDGAMVFTDVSVAQLPPMSPTANGNIVGLADVDGDGDSDLLVATFAIGTYVLLINDGTATFTVSSGAVPVMANATSSFAFVDLDLDGDLDLVRGSLGPPSFARNDGSGSFQDVPGAFVPGTTDCRYVMATDLDGDFDVDLIAYGTQVGPRIFRNQHRQLRLTTPPVVGGPFVVTVVSHPGYAVQTRLVQLAVGLLRLPQPLVLPPFGSLWLDSAGPLVFASQILPPSADVASLAFSVPAIPALIGVAVHAQAGIQEMSGVPALRLTSLVSAIIQ